MNGVSRNRFIFGIFVILVCILIYFLLGDTLAQQPRRVATIFLFAIFFWAFEIIPLYATSIAIVVVLSFMVGGGGRAGLMMFLSSFSSPVIMLFLGGFVLAASFQRHKIDEYLIRKLLHFVGHRPISLVAGFLFSGAFISMWISNTAATAMLLMLVKPVIDQLDAEDKTRRAIIIATALGANIGGIGTPIGTPPNAIAIGILAEHGIMVSFLEWMEVAVPIAVFLLLVAFVWLWIVYGLRWKRLDFEVANPGPTSKKGKAVMLIALGTIALWLTTPLHKIPEALTALLAVSVISAFGLITVKEIRGLGWDILILMWGGLALGDAIMNSGLAAAFTQLPIFSLSPLYLLGLFCLIALVMSLFISNTATANIILPIAMGFSVLDKGIMAMAIALTCSFALAFPISTPPNAMAYSTGEISTWDLVKSGGVVSILALALILWGITFII